MSYFERMLPECRRISIWACKMNELKMSSLCHKIVTCRRFRKIIVIMEMVCRNVVVYINGL